ncbi:MULTISPECIES: cytochrome c [unclassified Achromobacter]|uniref:cytochrome c n=1 Tax=unclassified Achromobacter TaxID=2626865 RepID=UPI000B51CC73|nr:MULTISPECIES: cytochrome c [unclassified Achromobacter]OWT70280.1 cytochrome C [Achromobacter sp. HZ34]OWT71820.1 cytochrome C [Achromobacter sp. HZ28]
MTTAITSLRGVLRGAAALLLAGAATAAAATPASTAPAAADQATLVQRGAYLAVAADCVACHTAQGGKVYAGGNPIASPVGTIWSTNITPSKTAGIGNYTEAQFAQALRAGVRADGANLYPAMPYTSYTKISDEDVHALYTYFMQGVAPVDLPSPQTTLPFPFNIRASMKGWNLLFNSDKRFEPTAGKTEQWLRGAYLTEALAHCATCHTPRNALMAEDGSRAFGGASLGKWYAPNISSDPVHGIGGWSQETLVAYLKTGHAPGHALAAGPMAEAIDHSLSKLTDADLNAIAVYIKTAAPVAGAAADKPSYAYGAPARDEAMLRGASMGQTTGAALYSGNCASCHQASGTGVEQGGPPSLLHVSAVGRDDPSNLVMTILDGVYRSAGTPRRMPAFAHELNDEEVAMLATYVRQTFGNPQAPVVTAAQVKALREPARPGPIVTYARVGLALAIVVMLLLAGWLLRRRRAA